MQKEVNGGEGKGPTKNIFLIGFKMVVIKTSSVRLAIEIFA